MSRRALLGGLAAGSVGAAILAGLPAPGSLAAVAQQAGGATVAANPHNVLSAAVTVATPGAKTIRVEYGLEGAAGGTATTPEFAVAGGVTVVPVLGLQPESNYRFQTVATGADGVRPVGEPLSFRTAALPPWMPVFEVQKRGTTEPGFTAIAPIALPIGGYPAYVVVIVDEAGEVVWYRQTRSMALDFQLQPNGHYTAGLSQKAGRVADQVVDAGVYEEWDILGNTVATWAAQGYDLTDWHELRLVNGGQEGLLFGIAGKVRDCRPVGGPAKGEVWGNVLQRLTRSGEVLFEWSAFDHFKLEEADDSVWHDPTNPRGQYDWTHSNAVDIDHDGNYLVSSRNFSEATKIDSKTGAIVWRMGRGKGNQFTFVDDPYDGFYKMHGIRRLSNGHLLLLDNGNGHIPPSSRAVEYEVDEASKTARLVWSFEPGGFGSGMGFAERLPSGNTLVNLGVDNRVFEVAPSGQVVWELSMPARGWGATAWRAAAPGQGRGMRGIYRATRIPSLYGAG